MLTKYSHHTAYTSGREVGGTRRRERGWRDKEGEREELWREGGGRVKSVYYIVYLPPTLLQCINSPILPLSLPPSLPPPPPPHNIFLHWQLEQVSEELHDTGEGISLVEGAGSQGALDHCGGDRAAQEGEGGPLEEPGGGGGGGGEGEEKEEEEEEGEEEEE